jgi:hypothetical protein
MSSQKPMSISCDNLLFSVSHKIWRLSPRPASLARGLAQEPWPEPIEFSTVTMPNSFFDREGWELCASRVAFSPTGKYVILNTLCRTSNNNNPHSLTTMLELQPTVAAFELTPALDAVPLLALALDHSFRSNFQIIFHPTRPLCVLWVGEDESMGQNASRAFLYFWNFGISKCLPLTQTYA